MRKGIFPLACILSLALLAQFCQASSVTRSFSKTTASGGEEITVSLAVSVTAGQTFYAIDETYPAGWTVTATSGDTNESRHVKFWVLQNAANTIHAYSIKAPAGPGTYSFSGLYMFEGMTSEAPISGGYQATVASRGDITGGTGGGPDGCIDIEDLSLAGSKLGLRSSDGGWDPRADIDKNGVVDIFDIVFVGKDFGAGCP